MLQSVLIAAAANVPAAATDLASEPVKARSMPTLEPSLAAELERIATASGVDAGHPTPGNLLDQPAVDRLMKLLLQQLKHRELLYQLQPFGLLFFALNRPLRKPL